MLLTPSTEVNELIGGVLARAVALTGVELHGFVVASNHVHLLVTAEGAMLSVFMQYFLGNVARKVGRITQWSGALWQRRFSAEVVLDDEAAVGRLSYILAHGVKEGLVRHPAEWPGLSCLNLLLNDGSETHRFFHWSARWKKGVLKEGGEKLFDGSLGLRVGDAGRRVGG
jgi:REP element-mobilizing transposase RayT